MKSTDPGATLVMAVPKERFTPETVEQALDYLLRQEGGYKGQRASWTTKPEWRSRMVALVHTGPGWQVQSSWSKATEDELPNNIDACQYFVESANRFKFKEIDCIWLSVSLFHANLDPLRAERVKRVLNDFRELVRRFHPTFAAVGHAQQYMVPLKGKDPRTFAWGAAYYGKDLVKKIGRPALLKSAAIVKEDWPDGGMWVQTWANPFIVAKELTEQMAQELKLRAVFSH